MRLLLITIVVFFIGLTTKAQSYKSLKKGRWVGYLELNTTNKLYFELSLGKSTCMVLNGEEHVPMNQPVIQNDSIHLFFSNFNSELVFKVKDKKTIDGRWVNHLKINYSIPFHATLSRQTIFPVSQNETSSSDFSGKWKTIFSPKESPDDAIGVFKQERNSLTGTFLTETGDYRFLSGNTSGNSMYLSGFDGSHAFLFTGKQNENGKIEGHFYSGTHYQTTWNAERNEHFELRNPDSLTRLAGDAHDLSLNFTHLDGTTFTFPHEKYKNKVIIIQILGTWCGNCMDETVYFKELYEKYHGKGLEIISVGYEMGNGFNDFSRHLTAYQKRFDLKHTIVVGGSAKKSSAKNDFGFLSDITSFPTSVFIDKSGKVVRIHTGFSGPSTGKYYTEYKEKTDKLIEQLINE